MLAPLVAGHLIFFRMLLINTFPVRSWNVSLWFS